MTAPIRNPQGMRAAVRDAIEERRITCGNVDQIIGCAEGLTNKHLSEESGKNFTVPAFFDALSAVGKCILIVDDPDQIQKVAKHWQRRKRIQSVATEQAYRASIESKIQEMSVFEGKLALREHMKALAKLGASKGGKRRAQTLGKRRRQAIAAHAARVKWAKAKAAKRRKDGKGKQRKRVRDQESLAKRQRVNGADAGRISKASPGAGPAALARQFPAPNAS